MKLDYSGLPKFESVRYLHEDEKRWFGASGYYIDGEKGGQYNLSSPEATTIRCMFSLSTVELQFSFLCMAILRHYNEYFMTEHLMRTTECGKLWSQLRGEVFTGESPWYGHAKYVMPYDDFTYKIVGQNSEFDQDEARSLYKAICASSYVLYESDPGPQFKKRVEQSLVGYNEGEYE